jgi:hypothetical protein
LRQPTEWEKNLCQLYIWHEINNQNVPGVQKLNSQKNQQPNEEKSANEVNRIISKEEVQMTKKKHMKKCPTSLAIKKKQIKTISLISAS